MKFFKGVYKGIANCVRAFPVLFSRGLWLFMFYPLIIGLSLWLGVLISVDAIWLKISNTLMIVRDDGHWFSFLIPSPGSIFSFMTNIVFNVVVWLISGILIKYILLILLSPFFALLSQKTDERLTGSTFPFSPLQLMKDIIRGIIINLRNMLWEYLILFLCFVITLLFPPLFIVTTPLQLLVSWYYIGFSLLDYNMERHGLGIGASINLIKANKGYAVGLGLTYSVFMVLPAFMNIVGLCLGPAICVIGATTSYLAVTGKLSTQAD